MEGKRALVEDVINRINTTNAAKQKVQGVEQLEELLLRNDPALLDEYLQHLAPLQMDRAASVRRKLLEFMAAAVHKRPTPAVLSTAAPCVTALLSDEQAQLAKEAAQTAHGLLIKGLYMLAVSPQAEAAAAAEAWAVVHALQQHLSSLAVSLGSSHGTSSTHQVAMCLAGIKMSEQAALAYTADSTSKLPGAEALHAEAQALLQQLEQLLAAPELQQRAGPVVICAVRALGCVCLQRPQLMPTALPPLLKLAQQKLLTAPKPGDGQSGKQASCGAALKDMLVRVYRSNSEAAKPWEEQLHQALVTMGADAAAASARRHLGRQAGRAKDTLKRKAAGQAGRDPKMARAATPSGADSAYGDTPARTPTPTPTPGPGPVPPAGPDAAAGGGVGPAQVLALFNPYGLPGVDPQASIDAAQVVMETLVQGEQHEAVQHILAHVHPDVLLELVMRWMDNLPPHKPEAPRPPAPPPVLPPAPQPAAQGRRPAAQPTGPPVSPPVDVSPDFSSAAFQQQLQLAVQALQQQPPPPPQQQQQQQQSSKQRQQQEPVKQQQQQQQQQQPAGQERATPPPPAAANAQAVKRQQQQQRQQQPLSARPAAQEPARSGPVLPSPLPTALRPEQLCVLRTAAVQRILGATRNKPIRNFRELLLGRLVSRAAAADDELTQLMLQHVLGHYHQDRGHLLLVRWLYALAAAVVTEAPGQAGPPAAADTAAGGSKGGVERAAAGAAAGTSGVSGRGAAGVDVDAEMLDEPDAAAAEAGGAAEGADVAAQAAGAADGAGDDAMQVDAADATDGSGGQTPAAQEDANSTPQQQQQPNQQEQEQQQQQDGDRDAVMGGVGQHSRGDSNEDGISTQPSSSSSPVADLSGTAYESVLLSALRGLRDHLPSHDPAIPRLLQDAPVLPLPAVSAFLQSLISEGADWSSVGLDTALALFEARPAARATLLQLVLDAAVCDDRASREKAVSLVVSRLIQWQQYAAVIEQFATEQLLLVLQPPTPEQQQESPGQQQAGQQVAGGQEPSDVETAQQQGQQQQQQEGQGAGEGGSGGAEQQQQQQQAAMTTEQAAQHSMLFMSLCTAKPELLQLLLETYGKAGPEARAALAGYAPSMARALGPTQPVLLQAVRQPPPGSLDLLLVMLTDLAEQQTPPQPLVDACKHHRSATGSVLLLSAVVPALPKEELVALLPQLLMQLPDQRLKLVYNQLAKEEAGKVKPFAPVELLVLLHRLEFSAQEWGAHKSRIIAAVDKAMRSPEVFPAPVLQTALHRMEEVLPIPRLFMRSVNIMVASSPSTIPSVIELLGRLSQKQIWNNKLQWKGFLVCCEKLQDRGGLNVLLQLPSSILETALKALPRSMWKALYDFANDSSRNRPLVYREVKKLVDTYHQRWLKAEIEQKQADIAASKAAHKPAAGSGPAAAAAGGGQAGAHHKGKVGHSIAQAKAAATPAAAAAGGGGSSRSRQGVANAVQGLTAGAKAGMQQPAAKPVRASTAATTPSAANADTQPASAKQQQQQQQQQQDQHYHHQQQQQQQEGPGSVAAVQPAPVLAEEDEEFVLDFDEED